MSDTGSLIRTARRARKLTQEALARRAGVSLGAVKGYERGARHPSQNTLRCLCEALGLPAEEAGALLDAAGYTAGALTRGIAPRNIGHLREEMAACSWPAFVTNQAMDVIAANEVLERAFGVDLSRDYSGFGERNFFAGMTHPEFAARLENWDEVARFLIGLVKGDPRLRLDDDRPLPWFETAVSRMLVGEPARISRLLSLWDEARPIAPALRFRYRIRWYEPQNRLLTFSCTTMLEDAATELHWNEWVPGDSATWNWCRTDDPTTSYHPTIDGNG